MKTSSLPRALVVGAITTALLAACATPPNANLEAARIDYTRAAADPVVSAAAPRELAAAKDELQKGDAAFADRQKPEAVDHYAYLSRQRVRAAVEAGQAARSDQATSTAQADRERIVAAARTAQAQEQAALAEQQAAQARVAAAAANQRADDLAAQLANARQTDRGTVVTLGDVLFDTGRATLKPGAMRTIDEVATFLAANPERKVMIEGYTDSTGSGSTNQTLSERRAESVRDALLSRNVSTDRIRARGMGAEYPVAGNDTAAGRQLNRRVEVVFSTPAGTFQSARG